MRYDLKGDPISGLPVSAPPHTVSIRFPESEPTRAIKKRLVSASQQGARVLQIVGDTEHPEAMSLLRECQRLAFDKVIFSGDLSGLRDAKPRQLFHLRGLHLVLYTPSEECARIAQQIQATASVEIGPFVSITGPVLDTDIAHMWDREGWPGEPRFGISNDVDWDPIYQSAKKIQDCPEKEALLQALKEGAHPLFGEPGSEAIKCPRGVTWPNLRSFAVQ